MSEKPIVLWRTADGQEDGNQNDRYGVLIQQGDLTPYLRVNRLHNRLQI
jgi:hypothetical protein